MFPHSFTRLVEPPLLLARIESQERDAYAARIVANGSPAPACVVAGMAGTLRHAALQPGDFPAVGDYVALELSRDGTRGVIRRVLERRNLFARRAAGSGSHLQPIAANIDTLFVAIACNRDFNLRRLERYLAGAAQSEIAAAIVLTKSDLAGDLDAYRSAARSVAAGRPVIASAALDGVGLEAFAPFRGPERTIAFVGSSGAGKSTLVNALLGMHVLDTGSARDDDDRGRHTTTRRQLLHLDDGTAIVDTPGMREFGLTGGDDAGGFDDVATLARHCRFSDCRHASEPGCAVLGELDAERLASYRKLAREAIFEAGKSDHAVRDAERRRWKSITKSARSFDKRRRGE